jgi:hypothetical protein
MSGHHKVAGTLRVPSAEMPDTLRIPGRMGHGEAVTSCWSSAFRLSHGREPLPKGTLKRELQQVGRRSHGLGVCLLLLLFLALCCGSLAAAERGQSYALLVAGHPGNPLYARHYRERLTRFHNYLAQRAHVARERISVLAGDADFREAPVSGPATAESISAALADFAKRVQPDDQFILVVLGHGAATEESCTLMLPGPDLELRAVGEALDRLAAHNQVVLNFASNSGDALSRLAHAGRVVIRASSPGQVNDSDFAEFFLQALETGAKDESAGAAPPAQPLSLLAAYHWATLRTAQWTVRQKLSENPESPGWTVDGKQSADVFQKLYSGPGVSADRRFVASPASEQPDASVEVVNKQDKNWLFRRLITEIPVLDDLGDGKGATALGSKGYQPLSASSPSKPGFLAGRVVLGDAQLLPVPSAKDK